MLLLKQSHASSKLERLDFRDRVSTGSMQLTVWEQPGQPEGGPLVLLAPGFGDEEAITREPAAKLLAKHGVRAGVVRHKGRAGLTAMHPREQRSMDVHRARQLAARVFRPEVTVLAGHSYGGPNSNDAANHGVRTHSSQDGPAPRLVVVHEAAPGLGDNPFDEDIDLRKEFCSMARHPLQMAALIGNELPHAIDRFRGIITTIGEVVTLRHIYIQPGKDDLQTAGVLVSDMYYKDDGLVAMPPECAANPETTVYDGSHLESYFRPAVLADHILGVVLPQLGY